MAREKIKKGNGLWVTYVALSILFCCTLVCVIGLFNASFAADYPSRPVEMLVAFKPGGGADTAARIIALKVSELLGHPVVVINKPGAGGIIGTYIAKAQPPDGYMIFVISPPMISAPFIRKGITFNILRDFIPINMSVTGPSVLVVKKDAPWRTLEEFIAHVKKNPGKVTFASAGYGGTPHFAGEIFKLYTGTDITHIPCEGIAEGLTTLLGGHVDCAFPELGIAHKYLKAGNLRGLAVSAKERLKDFPDIPTTVEKGFPNLMTATWEAFGVPAKTPREIVLRLETVFKQALKDKEVIKKYETTGWIVENLGSKAAYDFLAMDEKNKREAAKAAKIVPK